MAGVLVVGGGLAGVRMCDQLRAAGFGGRLTLIGAEDVAPYDRPPLSKQPGADVDLRPAMGLDVFQLADEVRLGTPARSLVRLPDSRWAVETQAGLLAADAVVIATGAQPVLPTTWRDAGVRTLRTRQDAHVLWDGMGGQTGLVVIGGGWIGCEVAATAAGLGASVTLVEAGPALLAELPAAAADRIAAHLRDLGVRLHLGTPVEAVTPVGLQHAAVVRSGEETLTLAGDLVVAGLGVRPCTRWLAGSEIRLTAGGAVVTDRWGRTSLPGVFAVGDVAVRFSDKLGRQVAGGHWTEAMQAPAALAPAVVESLDADATWWDSRPEAQAWEGIPYVFSDLGDLRLLVLGDAAGRHPLPGQNVSQVWREERGWTCFTLSGDRVLGLASTRPRDVVATRRAMSADPKGAPRADRSALADPGATPAAMFPPA